MEGTAGKGFRHDLVDDCGDSTMVQATKLTTKLATKKKSPGKSGSIYKGALFFIEAVFGVELLVDLGDWVLSVDVISPAS
jgi:hypothetical protein